MNSRLYLPVMKEFSGTASVRLAELEDLFVDMKARFDRVCKLFCEDPATSQSDEFFGVFDYFLGSFNEAKNENENIRRKREEEEKIAKQHQEMRMRTLERKKSSASRLNGHHVNNGGHGLINNKNPALTQQNSSSSTEKNEFDDLISALRTGDVFGENMDKFKRSRKIRHSPPRVDRVDSFLRERESNGVYHQQQPRHK